MDKHYTYLANWKMNFTLSEALEFASLHYDSLVLLAKNPRSTIVLCPSLEALHPVHQMVQGTKLNIGAQDCSDHLRGACTGQVSPQSLKQIGCSFCIIGHSELRALGADTNERIARKCSTLLDCDLSPVICVGENLEQHQRNEVFETIKKQLNPIFDMLKKHTKAHVPIFLAYEPIWAIGTGNVATSEHVELIFSWLAQEIAKNGSGFSWKLLYGGSVKSNNCSQLKHIPSLDGFLVGGASLDFEEFEKIVNYL